MLFPIIPLVMVVIGVLLYAPAWDAKINEIGRLLILAGFIAFAFANAGR